jgi:2-hydroxycyclohexanecarboxyl-CoA dehydrogenase
MARIALVTGGARGIGEAIARSLAADGHRVAVADIREEGAVQTASRIGGFAVGMDITDTDSVDVGVRAIESELGPIEILVNNAGWDEFRPFLETDEPFWERIIEINFKGCLRTSHRIVPGMVERGYGRIVNIGSDAARVGSSMEAVYSGAKGAVVAFTKTLAREVARYGITANSVCPGPTDTPMLQQAGVIGGDMERMVESLRRAVPMRRLAVPDDIAGAVSFLASDRAAFITGQTLSVSGGLTMA